MRRESHSVHGGCPAPEPGTHWRTTAVQPRLCVGRYEGTARLLGRSGRHHRLAALTIAMVTEPPYVCGADTWCLHRPVAIQPAHVARGRRRRDQHRGKKAQNPLLGNVCLLTTGGLIRVGQHCRGFVKGERLLGVPAAPAPDYGRRELQGPSPAKRRGVMRVTNPGRSRSSAGGKSASGPM
jgi:hypothetical protein